MLAAEAAAEQGIQQTAQILQLSAERLEQWCQQLGLISQSPKIEGMQPASQRNRWPGDPLSPATPRRSHDRLCLRLP